MKLLLCNQDWFAEEFRAAGHEALTCGTREHMQVRLARPCEPIESIISRLPGGFRPDRIVVYDESSPLFISGLEDTPMPTLFYSVDAHHHAAVHKYLAHVFDATLVAQRDYIPAFEGVGARAEWLPLWTSRPMEPISEKKYGAVFVGTLDAKLNPGRVAFFDRLKALAPIELMTTCYWVIFPFSEIVVNQTVKGDLNFRVFEAMMSGALLLTESSPNGLSDLFKDGAELVLYQKDNAEEAAEKIRSLLDDRARCRGIGAAGREAIVKAHLPIHRAGAILDILEGLNKRPSGIRHLAGVPNLSWLAKMMKRVDKGFQVQALGAALQLIDRGLALGERMPEEVACYAAACCIEFDRSSDSNLGRRLVERLAESMPHCPVFKLAHIWELAEQGQRETARRLAQELNPGDPEQTLSRIYQIIGEML